MQLFVTVYVYWLMLQIPLHKLKNEKSLGSLPMWMYHVLAYLLPGSPPEIFLQPSLFKHLRARGMPIMFLGVNSEREMRLAVTIGATAILSDRITYMANFMKEHPELTFKEVE